MVKNTTLLRWESWARIPPDLLIIFASDEVMISKFSIFTKYILKSVICQGVADIGLAPDLGSGDIGSIPIILTNNIYF